MAFTDKWKTAKQAFENATKSKKPSEKVLGVFRKGTGIEDALKKIDSVLAGTGTADDKFKKAGPLKEEFDRVSHDYHNTLRKAVMGEKAQEDPVYKSALEKLKFELNSIGTTITEALKKLLDADKAEKERAVAAAAARAKAHQPVINELKSKLSKK